MITFSKFGSWGRIGNQLFQWAFISTLSRKTGVPYGLPRWQYKSYFETPPAYGKIPGVEVKERQYGYSDYTDLDFTQNLDFLGYFQSTKYWDDETLPSMQIKREFREQVRDKYFYELSKPSIAVCIRRGDYVGNENYYNLPVHYYISALEKFDWRNYNLVFISDDLNYCKLHFGCLKNAFFPECTEMEALALIGLCENAILSNSTFHWWGAKLGTCKRVLQPTKLFQGKLLEQNGDVNFWDDTFESHKEERIPLPAVCFTIPVMYDHPDRKDNLNRCLSQLRDHFYANVILGEQGCSHFSYVQVDYMEFNEPHFHRTKMLNDMARMACAAVVVNLDCDVVLPPMQIIEAVRLIREGADMVYPYDGVFHRIRHKQKDRFKGDLGVYASDPLDGKPSFGGCVFWNYESFVKAGMENEYMISFGPEDVERVERAYALGLRVERVKGHLYHFAHWCGPNSSVANPLFRQNRALLEKQRAMNPDQLREYIKTWHWLNQTV